MNIITGILNREHITQQDKLKILWTPTDNISWHKLIGSLGHKLINFEDLYFAQNSPHIIICNNKVLFHKKCRDISIQFHIPVIMIDHDIRPSNLNDTQDDKVFYSFPTAYTIAMSENISKSWNLNYNQILQPEQIKDKEYWNNLIYKTSKIIFKYYG